MSTDTQPNNPLHGVKLEALLTQLVEHYGWARLAQAININCFKNDPSIKSSLKFLRRTPWARAKVEAFYLREYLQEHRQLPSPPTKTQAKTQAKTKPSQQIWPKP